MKLIKSEECVCSYYTSKGPILVKLIFALSNRYPVTMTFVTMMPSTMWSLLYDAKIK